MGERRWIVSLQYQEPAIGGAIQAHLAVVLEVLCEIDRGHAAGAQLPLDAVAVGEGRPEASRLMGASHSGKFNRFISAMNRGSDRSGSKRIPLSQTRNSELAA